MKSMTHPSSETFSGSHAVLRTVLTTMAEGVDLLDEGTRSTDPLKLVAKMPNGEWA